MRVTLLLLLAISTSGALAAEVTEVVETVPDHLAFFPQTVEVENVQDQLFAQERLWAPGYVLKVCFFGGNAVVNRLVAEVASEWQKHAFVTFDFGDLKDPRDCLDRDAGLNTIRVGYGERGYWSAVGTDSVRKLNQYQPSMNFEGFDLRHYPGAVDERGVALRVDNVAALASARDKSVVLHEFGHALGLLHEHQNPELGCEAEIKWQGEGNVYDYFLARHGWSRDKVDRNLGPVRRPDPDAASDGKDRDSLMMYSLPAAIFKKGTESICYVPPRLLLSQGDIAGIRKRYPPGSQIGEDIGFTPADLAIATAPSTPDVLEDHLQRIRLDLVSDESSVRREARRQLAASLKEADSGTLLRVIAQAASSNDYRTRLGTVVALGGLTPAQEMSSEEWSRAISALQQIQASTRDETLLQHTSAAIVRAKQWDIGPMVFGSEVQATNLDPSSRPRESGGPR